MKFGEAFRQMRLRRNKSIRGLALDLHLDSGNLSKMENGKLPPPVSATNVEALAKAAGFSSSETYQLCQLAWQDRLDEHKFRFWDNGRSP